MATKLILVAALIVCARAGGPAAYSISVPSIDHASVGQSQEHTVKGPLGATSHSVASSAVQTAHSTSHVSNTRISNDAVGYAPNYGAAHIAGPALAPALPIAHGPLLSHGPILGHGPVIGPAIAHGLPGPLLGGPLLGHGYGPAYGYRAPLVASHLGGPLGYPLGGPIVKAAVAAPLVHTAVATHGAHYAY